VRLVVFDILGRQVRTLVDGKLMPGKYTQTWDGRNELGVAVSSGIYFYELTAASSSGATFRQTRKMVLSR
ncbi:hypothetical protein HUU40_27335, partial [candidate division KSB1 bacterium]|nr:hypothetical protein [candidate division KSB1 bacterium]